MAQTALLDTLYYAKKFEEAGCSQELAEAQTLLMTELINHYVCTKHDLSHATLESKNALKNSQTYLEIKLKETESQLQINLKEVEAKIKDTESQLQIKNKRNRS